MSSSEKINQLSKRSDYFLRFHEYWAIEGLTALLLFLGCYHYFPFPVPLMVAWDGLALISITLTSFFIFTQHPCEIRKQLRAKDHTRQFFFLVVMLAAVASFLATWLLLNLVKQKFIPHLSESVTFALLTIALSWVFVHTRFAGLYAHFYYRPTKRVDLAGLEKQEHITEGLLFPGCEKSPDYWDFVYFSFVIGMTCQVADVGIAHHQLRRLVLAHGLLSFFFNTSILALVVNIIAGLF
jgi:uncharacterized membrane protein